VIDWTEGCQGTITYNINEIFTYNGLQGSFDYYATGKFYHEQVWTVGKLVEGEFNLYEASWTANVLGNANEKLACSDEGCATGKHNLQGSVADDTHLIIILPQSEKPPYIVRIAFYYPTSTSTFHEIPFSPSLHCFPGGDCSDDSSPFIADSYFPDLEITVPQHNVTHLTTTVGPRQPSEENLQAHTWLDFLFYVDPFTGYHSQQAVEEWDIDLTCE